MKRILVAIFVICLGISYAQAAEPTQVQQLEVAQKVANMKAQREAAFERRLNLTEVQKLKAREIRRTGHEKLTPIFEEIKSKKQEAEMVRRSRMAVQMQEEKLTVIDAELKVLEKKANDIRRANMKEFESILTRQQKKALKQMKKEGRQRYHATHPSNMQKMLPAGAFGQHPQLQNKK